MASRSQLERRERLKRHGVGAHLIAPSATAWSDTGSLFRLRSLPPAGAGGDGLELTRAELG